MKELYTDELSDVMFQVFRLMKERMAFSDEMIHLSVLQIHTLIFLNRHDNSTMGDIAEAFHIEMPSATSLLNKLCELKLVERREDKEDRRLVRISLTGDGKKMVKKVVQERKEKLWTILTYLPERDRVQLLAILKTLLSKLKE